MNVVQQVSANANSNDYCTEPMVKSVMRSTAENYNSTEWIQSVQGTETSECIEYQSSGLISNPNTDEAAPVYQKLTPT